MAKKPPNPPPTPQRRRQKRRGCRDAAFVELGGVRHYCGPRNSAQARQTYHRLLAEWSAGGGRLPTKPDETTVVELCERFWSHAKTYYVRPDGKPTMLDRVKYAIRPLRKLYGRQPATAFGPNALRAVRQTWIDAGLSRKYTNDLTATVKHVFKWGASYEIVPASIYEALRTVEGLRRGRCKARETPPVVPVPETDVDAIRPHVSRQVWALVQLQLLCGARSCELLRVRPIDIDTGGRVWTFALAEHKTERFGIRRTIYLGPKCQEIIRPFLARPVDAYLFSPAEAVAELRAEGARCRRREDQRPDPRQSDRVVRDHYDTNTYRRAIERGCQHAGVPSWSPHRLRHNCASNLRREHGIDVAQTVLGHRLGSDVTELYAAPSIEKAKAVIALVG